MGDKVLVAPSVLSADFIRLGEDLESVTEADLLHYDVMDGRYVPNVSFGQVILGQVKEACDLPLDVHLMVERPDDCALSFVRAGADIVTFHYEAQVHAHRLVSAIHDAGARAGVAINPGTPVAALDALVEHVDLVLVMTVNPGFGGQSFIESSIRKIEQLKRLCTEHGASPLIEVDGGIDENTARRVVRAGARVLVAGSSVFGAKDRAGAIAAIRESGMRGLGVEV